MRNEEEGKGLMNKQIDEKRLTQHINKQLKSLQSFKRRKKDNSQFKKKKKEINIIYQQCIKNIKAIIQRTPQYKVKRCIKL